jgi:16S rRNA (guanine966-N2)-methyltransferase
MRVITGEAKGRRLKGPPGPKTRPMTDKIKEALFATLSSLGVEPERVLDLYAGTGSIGIEALSRGAGHADFVDQQAAACAVVRWNLQHTGFTDRATVHHMPVAQFLRRPGEPYDFVILDPPYADPEIISLLETLSRSSLVHGETTVVLGHWPRLELPERIGRLVLLRHRCHGDSCFSIFAVEPDDAPEGEAE